MDNRKSAPKWRLDQPEFQPPNPHMYDLPEQKEIRSLMLHLNDQDLDFREFSERLNRFPGLNRYVVALANYYVPGGDRRVESSAHAAALLGIRGLQNYFEPLTDDDRQRAVAG